MIDPASQTAHTLPGGRQLDPDRPTPDEPRPAPPPQSPPPGLKHQAGATRDALLGLVRAHVDLAKAELDEIKGEIGRAAALGGAAIACLILLSLLLAIGGMLFAGEWIFGSIGWGLLLGSELLVAVAISAVLAALRVEHLGRDVLGALLLGVVVGLVLGFNLPRRRTWAWTRPCGRSWWASSSSASSAPSWGSRSVRGPAVAAARWPG
jgi:hypothetical protein